MPIQNLDIGEPFFSVRVLCQEAQHYVKEKTIVLNLSNEAIAIRDQQLAQFQSVILTEVMMENVQHAVIIERFAAYANADEVMARIRKTWPSAFMVRKEERLKGTEHYMSPKVWVGQFGFTMYHSASVPLNVGLHRDHAFCPVAGYRELHTQILGFGKMQQCREQDVATLYLEEPMAPGTTHRPMYDALGNYPWHQYETITPSVFMAVEMLPDGMTPPALGTNDALTRTD